MLPFNSMNFNEKLTIDFCLFDFIRVVYAGHPQHQQQVAQAVDRAKQVTMTELNAVIGVNNPIDG